MKSILTIIPIFAFLTGCYVDTSPTASPTPPANQNRSASVSWYTVPLTGGGTDVYARVNGRDYLAKNNVRFFNTTQRHEYVSMGIPSSASTAGLFGEQGDSEEDNQGIYAAIEGSNVVLYTGYYAPGAMHDVQWGKLRSIPF
jgi:hypothetical protein